MPELRLLEQPYLASPSTLGMLHLTVFNYVTAC